MECGCVFSTLNGVLFNSKQQKQKKNWWILNSFAIIKTWKTQQQRNRTQIQHGRKQEHQSWTMLFVLVLIFIVDVVFGLFFLLLIIFLMKDVSLKPSTLCEWSELSRRIFPQWYPNSLVSRHIHTHINMHGTHSHRHTRWRGKKFSASNSKVLN